MFLDDFLAVEPDGERALVLDRDGHVGAEDAGLDDRDHLLTGLDDVLVEVIGEIRGSCVDERRAVAVVAVGIERKLRDEKETSADIR